MNNGYIDAIEPWAAEEIHRRQLFEQAMATRQQQIHQVDIHEFDEKLIAQPQTIQSQHVGHSTVNSQHVDVDV